MIKKLFFLSFFLVFSFNKTNAAVHHSLASAIIDDVAQLYFKQYAQDLDAMLVIDKRFEDNTTNAYSRMVRGKVILTIFGGLISHETMTEEAVALVACHEIGHRIAGAPLRPTFGSSSATTPISAVGQSDYFAAAKCLKRYFGKRFDQGYTSPSRPIDPYVTSRCYKTYSDDVKKAVVCSLVAQAGYDIANFFASLRNQAAPSFQTPDQAIADKTFLNHPKPQCRLDTYFAGALCDADPELSVSNTDPSQGYCDQGEGARPTCWFAN